MQKNKEELKRTNKNQQEVNFNFNTFSPKVIKMLITKKHLSRKLDKVCNRPSPCYLKPLNKYT